MAKNNSDFKGYQFEILDKIRKDFFDRFSTNGWKMPTQPSDVFDNFRIPFILSRANDEIEVTILRSSLWFYKDQKTTLGEVRKYFTPDGILSLLKDGFIKVREA